MMRSTKKQRATRVAALAALVALGVTGCSGNDGKEGANASSATSPTSSKTVQAAQQGAATSSASSSATTESADAKGAEVPKSVDAQSQDAAKKYLNARENASSAYQKDQMSWVDEAKPAITPKLYAELKKAGPMSGQYEWDAAHKAKIKVKTSAQCDLNPNAPSTDTMRVLICSLTDMVVDEQGKPMPVSKVPPQWGNAGPMPTVQLVVKKSGSSWLVDSDATGLAG